MKKIYLILVLSLPLSMFAQSKFSVEANSSSMVIKGDAGLAFGGAFGYQASKRTTVVLGVLHANINSDINYNLNKYYLNAIHRLNDETSKFGIASILGFSYFDFDDKLNLNGGSGFGIDLGVKSYIKQSDQSEYGFNLISTYNSQAPGAILEAGLFFKYTF